MRWFLYNVKTNGLLGLDSISDGYIRLLITTLFHNKPGIRNHIYRLKNGKRELIDWQCWYMTKGIYIICADKLEDIYEAIERIFEYEMENKKV